MQRYALFCSCQKKVSFSLGRIVFLTFLVLILVNKLPFFVGTWCNDLINRYLCTVFFMVLDLRLMKIGSLGRFPFFVCYCFCYYWKTIKAVFTLSKNGFYYWYARHEFILMGASP